MRARQASQVLSKFKEFVRDPIIQIIIITLGGNYRLRNKEGLELDVRYSTFDVRHPKAIAKIPRLTLSDKSKSD